MAEPDSIPDLSGWWDASDNSTIVEAPSGFCQSINNKAGTAKTYSQAVSGARPAIVTVGGVQGLAFDGSGKFMGDDESNSVLQPGAGDFTAFALVRVSTGSSTSHLLWVQADGFSPSARWALTIHTGIVIAVADGVDVASVSGTDETFDDGTTLWVIMGVRDGSDLRLYYGSVSTALTESASSPSDCSLVGTMDSTNSALGNFAHTQPASNYWDGELFQWGFYKRALSAGERAILFEGLLGLSSNPPFGAVASETPASAALLGVPVQQATGDVTAGPGSTRSRQRYFNGRLNQ